MALLFGNQSGDLAATFIFGFTIQASQGYCQRHAHPCFELVLHPSGRGHTTVGNDRRIDLEPGDAVLYPPRESHDQKLSVPGEEIVLQFECRGLVAERTRAWRGWLNQRNLAIARQLAYHPTDGRHMGRSAGHLIMALLHYLDGGSTAESEATDPSHAGRARLLIAERYRDLGRLEEVAEALGVSHDHLRHCFRAAYGMSLVAWLTEVRLARARELLLRTPLTLAEIAADVGWPSARYLCTVFRTRMGTTPICWRRSRQAQVILPRGRTSGR